MTVVAAVVARNADDDPDSDERLRFISLDVNLFLIVTFAIVLMHNDILIS